MLRKEAEVCNLATRPRFPRWEGDKITIAGSGVGWGALKVVTEGEVWCNVYTPMGVAGSGARAVVTSEATYFLWWAGVLCPVGSLAAIL